MTTIPKLIWRTLDKVVTALRDGEAEPGWAEARAALEGLAEEEPDATAAVEQEDADALSALVEGWRSGERILPAKDRGLLKRAMKAYKKRLKLTVLDAESAVGRGPMSSGGGSAAIVAITPPKEFPSEVWQELARQGRLVDCGQGMYEQPAAKS